MNTTLQLGIGLKDGATSIGEVQRRIRRESRSESEKGRWFENLVARVLLEEPDYEVTAVHRWTDWPERTAETGLDGRDLGIDLVARHKTGSWIAIQCKCYAESARVGKPDIDSFLANSQRAPFSMRWIVATCSWTKAAEAQIQRMKPAVRRIDFMRHEFDEIAEKAAERPVRQPWSLQTQAIKDVVRGLKNHDRGRLIMACGTGKTFTSLRIAENVVATGGRILFMAPSIALVSQARREWLRHTTRDLDCRVVCSDTTAGGRGENRHDIGLSELVCDVTSDPSTLAAMLSKTTDGGPTRVVFCTYQSLDNVSRAQREHGAPPFDLALMDEAHRTTGVTNAPTNARASGFRAIHDDDRLRARKRLYMTATPRIYTAASRSRARSKGLETVDMSDQLVYGPELHRLSFSKAVNAEMLSDYRVIVLGIHHNAATPGVRRQLIAIGEEQQATKPLVVTEADVTRLLGTSLAINGATEGSAAERPGRLHRTIAFANSIARSRFYAQSMNLAELRRVTTRRIRAARKDAAASLRVESEHLDASHSALERGRALRDLRRAGTESVARMLFNVGLFSEGVDVPSLDAIVFMEPRSSQVDIVQAVGGVMRKSEGKRLGYIVVPIPIEPGQDPLSALAAGTSGYQALGKVLRALASHDERMAEDPLRFVQTSATGPETGATVTPENGGQYFLDLQDVSQAVYAHVVAASGLGKPGLQVSQDIEHAVRSAASYFKEGGLGSELAATLGLASQAGDDNISKIAALLLANACLLHRRLCDVPGYEKLATLNQVGSASNPAATLRRAWTQILERDYAPVFEPPLAVLDVLPDRRYVDHALRTLSECANRVADSLSELGYDHSGPLYHRILPNAKAYGAFYTNNLSALMLARLALSDDFCDWSDREAVSKLRIMDPACGTGTLLMAALHVIKKRAQEAGMVTAADDETLTWLHQVLVEDVLCGLDVNRHAIQLAACNLTLGAPTVDYKRMNLLTLKHGPQPDGTVRAGSLEILGATDRADSLETLIRPLRTMTGLGAEQVDRVEEAEFPLKDLDLVVMNPPFTNNRERNRQWGVAATNRMQRHERSISSGVVKQDEGAGAVINANAIRTFFVPLGDRILGHERGTLASVIPATACTGASGLQERQFLARRFHIERIVTSHDPNRIAFSENTTIYECLLIARRWPSGVDRPPTEFVSLREMPSTPKDMLAASDAIADGQVGPWGRCIRWPAARILAGDWTPVQWYDGDLATIVRDIERCEHLEPLGLRYEVGPAGQGVLGVYTVAEPGTPGAVAGFHSVSGKIRRTVLGKPDVVYEPRPGKERLAKSYLTRRAHFLVAMRMNTVSGHISGLWTEQQSFGWWVPVQVPNERRAKALAAWWNSTPARLMLLNRRAKTFTYPMWQLQHLRQIRIPTPRNPAWASLTDAWQEVRNIELLPMRDAATCTARSIIDAAAAAALGVPESAVAGWRLRLAAEPTITNQRAPAPEPSPFR